MSEDTFEIRQCPHPACGLRFPVQSGDPRGARCPACRHATFAAGEPFERFAVPPTPVADSGLEIEALLDNVRSGWNVGAMFRSADGAGLKRLHLAGITPPPDYAGVKKTALGAENSLPWTQHPSALEAARQMRARGLSLWALEGGERAEPLFALPRERFSSPLGLVVGNELAGVDPEVMALCAGVVCLPMLGVKGSLNVAVAFGAAVYYLRFGLCQTG